MVYSKSSPTFTVESVSQVIEMIEAIGASIDFFYRGEKSSHPSISTSLERYSSGVPEQELLNVYRERIHHHLQHVPESEDYLQWFSLMQHHGAPTRLLDVTRSLFVAMYFATEHNADCDGTVFCFFTPDWFWREDAPNPQDVFNFGGVSHNWKPGVLPVKPARLSKRMIAQQGHFLMPTQLNLRFEENLKSTFASNPYGPMSLDHIPASCSGMVPHADNPLVRLIIPRSKFTQIRITLTQMNITTESLFPDFDGVTRSLNQLAQRFADGY
jgi:hypothetical protein